MTLHLGIGAALLIITTVIHGLAMRFSFVLVRRVHAENWNFRQTWTGIILTAGVVLVMFAAAVIEAFVWALTYIGVGALESVDRAMYFSLVTYTTLGFGDVTLTPDWALLSAVQAANGTIMFGWSTALIFWFVQQVFRPKQMKHSNVLYPNGE